jgi:predicted amidohydrolase
MAEEAIAQASIERVDLICFPECFVPGYGGMGKAVPPPDNGLEPSLFNKS